MEEAEREWRKKETLEAKKKSEMEAMLIEARKQQMQEKEHFLAVQAQKDRAEFEHILRWVFTAIHPQISCFCFFAFYLYFANSFIGGT